MSRKNCLKTTYKGVKELHLCLEDSKENDESIETDSLDEDSFMSPL